MPCRRLQGGAGPSQQHRSARPAQMKVVKTILLPCSAGACSMQCESGALVQEGPMCLICWSGILVHMVYRSASTRSTVLGTASESAHGIGGYVHTGAAARPGGYSCRYTMKVPENNLGSFVQALRMTCAGTSAQIIVAAVCWQCADLRRHAPLRWRLVWGDQCWQRQEVPGGPEDCRGELLRTALGSC